MKITVKIFKNIYLVYLDGKNPLKEWKRVKLHPTQKQQRKTTFTRGKNIYNNIS